MRIDWRDSKNGGDAEFDVVKKNEYNNCHLSGF